MTAAWVDTSVIVRLLTGDPPEQAQRARAVARVAERGDMTLRVDPLVLAETVWVLTSYYGMAREAIASALAAFVGSIGVAVEDAEVVREALRSFAERNISFVDCFVAAKAKAAMQPVCSFDRDFRRLDVELIEPAVSE